MKNLTVILAVFAVSAISSYVSYEIGYKSGYHNGIIEYEILRHESVSRIKDATEATL